MNTGLLKKKIELIKFKAEAILRREVMEANCLDFPELADKMATHIINICDAILEKPDWLAQETNNELNL